MDADQFLGVIFEDCQGVVVTCDPNDMRGHRWVPGKTLSATTYFCISTVRETNGRDNILRRKTQDLVLTYCMVLDDVGTKVSRETLLALLPPTWKMRTSMPDGVSNEQWGFAFKDPIAPDKAKEIIEALARAGLTDAGAKRADRVMRLPGSLNEKYDPPFVAELLEMHPERFYSWSELVVRLKLELEGVPPMPTGPEPLPEGKVDPLVSLIYDAGIVRGDPARGWIPIHCPWEGEHTPGDGQAHGCDYHPGWPHGQFNCQHAHDNDPPNTADFVEWLMNRSMTKLVTPEASTGLMSQAAFKALQGQLATRGMIGHDDPERPPTPREEAASDFFRDTIHVGIESKWWSQAACCLLDDKALNVRWYPILLHHGLLDGLTPAGRPTIIPPSKLATTHPRTQRVARIIHRLGQPLIVEDCLNIAPPIPLRAIGEGAPEPWLDLVSFVCSDVAEVTEYFLDWMAFTVTAWDEKPGWHVLLKGEHGTGKNLALRPVSNHLMNGHWDKISAADIDQPFNPFLNKRLVQVDELQFNTKGTISTHDIYNKIKSWTARGSELIVINDKNMKRYSALDRSCWAITSNAAVPLPLERGDRRFLVIETPRLPWPEEDYQAVVDWLDQGGDAVATAWLHRRWDAMPEARRKVLRGRAPDTEAKQALMIGSAEGIEGAVRLAIEGHADKPWPNLMQVSDVMYELAENPRFTLLTSAMKRNVNAQRIALALRAGGAVRLFGGDPVKGTDRRSMRLWCLRPSMAQMYEALGYGQKLIDRYRQEQSSTKTWADVEEREQGE